MVKFIARGGSVSAGHCDLFLASRPGSQDGSQPTLGRIVPLDYVVQGLTKVVGGAGRETEPTRVSFRLRYESDCGAKAAENLIGLLGQLGPEALDHCPRQGGNQLSVGNVTHRTSVRQ
jgi:hypothetical protein